jgi:tetratricopeptide (TPR) repeat protein
MQNIRLTAFIAALTLLAIPPAQANPIDECNQSENPEKQIDGCTEFLQLDPFSPYVALAYGRRGEAYMRKGDLGHAIADFDQAVAIDGRQARLYVGRGLAYRDKGDLDRAIEDLSKAIELDSKFGEAFINRCVVYDHKGERDRAIADYRAALAKNPTPQDRKDLEAALKHLGASP